MGGSAPSGRTKRLALWALGAAGLSTLSALLLVASLVGGPDPDRAVSRAAERTDTATSGLSVATVHDLAPAATGVAAGTAGSLRSRLPAGVVDHGDVAASPDGVSLSEISIAVDRFQPDRVVAAAMSLLPDGRIWTTASQDGGKTWSQTTIPISSDARFHADPMVTFDSRGVAHLVHIPVTAGNSPVGIEVNRSLDGGQTWSGSLRISARRGDDKVIVVADDHPDSPFRDHVYVAWKLPSGGVFFSRSEDRGLTFTQPREISSVAISGLDLATSHDGSVYLAANSATRGFIVLFRSLDGGFSFEPARHVARVRAGWYTSSPSVCARMALVHASIGIDRSQGAGRGNLYVSWSDYPSSGASGCSDGCSISEACAPDVFVSRSVDRGESWSPPKVVHETGAGRVDQYHQWLEVDPATGAVSIAYKDTRDDPVRLSTHVYLSRSEDAAETFDKEIRLSSASSVARGNFQYGDYQGLAATAGRVYTAWADFRSSPGSSRIYISRVDFVEGLAPRPAAVDFGSVDVGRKRQRKVILTHNGGEEIGILGVEIRGADRGVFSLRRNRCAGAVLRPGRSCRFKVRFRPTGPGTKEGVVVVDLTAASQPRLRIELLGTAASVTRR